MARVMAQDIIEMKARGEKIPMITSYDYTSARIADEAGVPILLVGDSVGMVVLGYDSTVPVTMDEILHHLKAVTRGAQRAHVVGDLPFMSYHLDIAHTLTNAGRIMQEGRAQSIKLEGGERIAETVHHIVECGIPVMGHIGLTPQSAISLGGYRVQGQERQEAAQLLKDAIALQQAGVYAIVLELVPAPLARLKQLVIPTIGIGAGPYCDGQVQVFHDLLGLFTDFIPKHTKQYLNLGEEIKSALTLFTKEVKDSSFPTAKESFDMDETILEELITPP